MVSIKAIDKKYGRAKKICVRYENIACEGCEYRIKQAFDLVFFKLMENQRDDKKVDKSKTIS